MLQLPKMVRIYDSSLCLEMHQLHRSWYHYSTSIKNRKTVEPVFKPFSPLKVMRSGGV